MNNRRMPFIAGAMVAVVMAFAATLVATTVTVSGVTLDYPSYPSTGTGLLHCEPWNDETADDVTLSGVPEGSNVSLQFTFSSGLVGAPLIFPAPINLSNVGGDPFAVEIPYPQDTTSWPYQSDSLRSIVVSVFAIVTTPDGSKIKLASKKWKVSCVPDEPDEGDFAGCTPGFWKTNPGRWVGYAPEGLFDATFGVDSSLDPPGPTGEYANPTLLQAVDIGGGGENAMARHAVAALLNAANPDVNYPMTEAEVIAAVQAAYTSGDFETPHLLFEGYNEIGCPVPADEASESNN